MFRSFMSTSATYRPGVVAVVRDPAGLLLLGERSDLPGTWQFPQGGRWPEETPEEALARELTEEVSLRPGDYRVLRRVGPYRYEFPPGRTREGYAGQEHLYFLVELTAPAERVNVATPEPEFRAVRWVAPAEFTLAALSPMKREPYRRVFRDLFGLDLA